MAKVYLLIAVLLMACGGPGAPDTISISSEFSDEEQAAIRGAVGDWCDAVGWCPEETRWTERGRIYLVDGFSPDAPEGAAAYNDLTNIEVRRDRERWSLDFLWVLVAHEIGHYCTGHLDSGLMRAKLHTSSQPEPIDDHAVDAWREGCH